ncbi:ligand-binding sensor domain-containing diguanylate cyclase [Idiomarina sp. A28L]|uniref:ligand-binding sensor domain-containing diguanylate cyclase n=1 Tax=Idiomarina sp. A28L TaxID=1036674 RepID=UPI00130219FF|nr:ligand-binding sensor domain-containing diguanylate cyclase [Idiomarina sp. A28L]
MQKIWLLGTAIFLSLLGGTNVSAVHANENGDINSQVSSSALEHSLKPFSRNSKPLSQYALSHWNTRDGLPHNSVNGITQTNDGYLWLGTWEGPVRFNGRDFTVFDNLDELKVPELGVMGIALNRETNEIVIGGPRGGISRFNGERWQPLPAAPSFIFSILVDSEQNVWAAASGAGFVRYDTEANMHRYQQAEGLPSNFAYHVYEAPAVAGRDREIWVGTSAGLARYERETDRFEAVAAVSGSQVRAVLQHSNGMLLAASDDGLFYQSKADTEFKPWPVPIEGTITSLAEGPNHAIWFGTLTNGLGRISDSGISTLSVQDGLPNPHVLDIFKDREDNMWVSTHGGLVQLRDALFTSFTRTQGLVGNYVRATMADQKRRLWVGTNEGVSRFENMELGLVSAELKDISVLAFGEDPESDAYYVGSYTHGLLQVIDDKITARYGRANGMPLAEVRAIQKLPGSEYLALGTPIGLVIMHARPGELTHVRTFGLDDGLIDPTITGLELDENGNLWAASTAGISKIHTNGVYSSVDEWQIEAINLDEITLARNTFAALSHKRNMWFATDRGVLVYSAADCSANDITAEYASLGLSHSSNPECWRWLSRRNGMPLDKYFSLAFDTDENLWLGSSRGITRVSRANVERWLENPEAMVTTNQYLESDGMASSQVNTGGPSSVIDDDGHIWYATAEGVAVIAPEDFDSHGLSAPPLVIEKARSNAGEFFSGARLKADDDRIEFQYIGLGYRMAAHIQYQVKLAGFDDEWISRGSFTFAEYTSLPPGEFTFSVRSRYPGGGWSDSVDISFSKAPHYYQTWWFWLVVVAAIFALIWHRVRSLHKNQERLERLVEEKTAALEALAHEDALTGLPNRRAFDQRLQLEVKRSLRNGAKLSLAVLDLDHFKQVNDQYLHEAGDRVLQKLAQVLTSAVREVDYVARWGGEEFAILFPGSGCEESQDICERIRQAIEGTDFADINNGIHITASIGVAELDDDFDYQSLMVRADKALYEAKGSGRNTTRCG